MKFKSFFHLRTFLATRFAIKSIFILSIDPSFVTPIFPPKQTGKLERKTLFPRDSKPADTFGQRVKTFSSRQSVAPHDPADLVGF